jgi:hypothetical protein
MLTINGQHTPTEKILMDKRDFSIIAGKKAFYKSIFNKQSISK